LFSILDDDTEKDIEVMAIHDDTGYQRVRETLSAQYNIGNRDPNIQVFSVDVRGDRSLTLHHTRFNRKPLDNDGTEEVLKHIHRLWGFDIHLESIENGEVKQKFTCPPVQEKKTKERDKIKVI